MDSGLSVGHLYLTFEQLGTVSTTCIIAVNKIEKITQSPHAVGFTPKLKGPLHRQWFEPRTTRLLWNLIIRVSQLHGQVTRSRNVSSSVVCRAFKNEGLSVEASHQACNF